MAADDSEDQRDQQPGRSAHDEFGRLERALDVWGAFRAMGPAEPARVAAWLAEHEDLRDLLEPLLEDATGAVGGAESAAVAETVAGEVGAAAGSDESLAKGRSVGNGEFELIEEIGRGGMGVVYRARQQALDRTVAVKVVADVLGMAPRAIARFRREATTAGRLQHAGIVEVLASGEDEGLHWLAMEFLDGASLDRHCRGLPLRERLELIARVADALHHAHESGVVHRDVKPSNVLVRARDGQPVLTDFGLAREQGLPALSRTGEFAGTPYYVAPEQARGDGAEVDRRADVFSLGVTAYEIVTGKRPFDGPSTAAILQSIAQREPPDPQRLAPGEVRRDLAAILLKALEKQPSDRYESAAAFAADLRAFLDLRPVQARRAGPVRRLVRFARREPLRFALFAVVALGVSTVGVLGWRLLAQQGVVEVGSETLRQREVDRLLSEGLQWKFVQLPELADEAYERAVALAPNDPLVIVQAAMHYAAETQPGKLRKPARALEILAAASPEVRALPSLQAARRWAETASLENAAPSNEASALELFVYGNAMLSRGFAGDGDAAERAFAALRSAALRSERASQSVLGDLHVAAFLAEDEAIERDTVDALLQLWPESPTSHVFETFYWYDRDDERCRKAAQRLLEIQPGFFWAHWKIAEMDQRAGDLDAALLGMERAWQDSSGYLKIGASLAMLHWERSENEQALAVAEQMAEISNRRDPLALQVLLVAELRMDLKDRAARTQAEQEALVGGK